MRCEKRRIGFVLAAVAVMFMGLAGLAMAAEPTPAPAPSGPSGFVGYLTNPVPQSLPFHLTGQMDIGYLIVQGNRNSPNFRTYRDIEEGFLASRLRLGLETKDRRWFAEFEGADLSKGDQRYTASAGQYGRYRLDFMWDQIPHWYATDAKTAFVRSEGGVFNMPTSVSAGVQCAATPTPVCLPNGNTGTTAQKFNRLVQLNGANSLDLMTNNDILKTGFWYAPLPELDIQLAYDHTRRAGNRPMGAGFGSPGGSVVEIPEPIEWQTDQMAFTAGYSTPVWQLQAGYRLSIFGNDIKTATFGNPQFATPTPTGFNSNLGRIVLAPDNQAHNIFVNGGVNLPWWNTRVTGKVAYSMLYQDDTFYSQTINPLQAGNPSLRLFSNSLGGDTRNLLINSVVTTRPIRDVTVTGSYRFFDYDPHTLSQTSAYHMVRDTGAPVADTLLAVAHAYQKQNADLDVGWNVLRPLTLQAGFGWERWDRDNISRETDRTDEYSVKVGTKYQPLSWLGISTKAVWSWRSISFYNTYAHVEHLQDIEEIGANARAGQDPGLRKFDEAARDRQRAELNFRLTPLDNLEFGLTGSYMHDNYPFSYYGLLNGNAWNVGFDGSYTPFPWLMLRASYMHEEYHAKIRSQSRTLVGTTLVDNLGFDWQSRNVDTYDTFGVGTTLRLIPDRLDFQGDYNYSRSIARMVSGNPNPVTCGNFSAATGCSVANIATATASSFPDDRFSLNRFSGLLRLWLLKNLALRAGYTYERFRVSYWQTDFIQPVNNSPPISGASVAPGAAGAGTNVLDVFLAARPFKSYEAHIIGLGVIYGF